MSRTTPADAAAEKPRGLLRKFFGHSAVRYLIVGGLSFAVDFGLLVLLREVFHWDVGIASATAFLTSLVFNFLVQRKFSFESAHRTHVSMIRYGVLVVANTLATVLIVQLLTPTILGYMGGKVVSTAAMTVWNYFLYKHWVFGKKPAHHGAHAHKHLSAGPDDAQDPAAGTPQPLQAADAELTRPEPS
ncbi:putative flippase GtrA [Arthrobacter ginsengisoli]|uniref:Flippase GtrA n=1 Tax=Arthrobacter ginsengisoli TaxID=1356565 RepID=A0ABU1UCX6_9MICC|nr:GtrA family protein [Arthrobacter ginsengisoli]MDR7083047.1 putative flippase GtrA [Arthrobacter ginsengisoli]